MLVHSGPMKNSIKNPTSNAPMPPKRAIVRAPTSSPEKIKVEPMAQQSPEISARASPQFQFIRLMSPRKMMRIPSAARIRATAFTMRNLRPRNKHSSVMAHIGAR